MDSVDVAERFASGLAIKIKSFLTLEFPKLNDTWNDLWDEDEKKNRMDVLENHLFSHITNLFNETMCQESQVKEEYIDRVEQLLDDITKLETALSVKIPYSDVQSLPLHSMALRLNQKTERYRHVYDERMRLLSELTEREAALAVTLGALPVAPDLPATPSEADLERLAQHVKTLETEKLDRMGTFMRKRQRIIELHAKLGAKPLLNFERSIVSEEIVSTFQVTNDNMEQLDDLLERLENQLKIAEERRDDLLASLRSMWSYLEEPADHQASFLAAHAGCTSEDFAAIQAELERCKKEKSANIEKFVVRIREELVDEWDRCMVAEETREECRVFHIAYFNEDIYDLHEMELNRWRKYYEDNKTIYDLYEQHTAKFDKLLELNGRGKSANRYQNRGGQLLQEEKQRKMVAKELPRLEEELRKALADYEEKHGQPFTAFGRPLIEVIDENWAAHFDQKTVDKFRNPGLCNGRTPLAVKRPAQPSTSSSAKMGRVLIPSSLKKNTRSKNNENCLQEPDSTITIEPNYDEFQRTFKSRLGANKLVSRSTEVLTPRKVFREREVGGMSGAKSTQNLAATPRTVPKRTRPAPAQTRTPLPPTRTPVPPTRTPLPRTRLPVIL